jgi:hypothetical protein
MDHFLKMKDVKKQGNSLKYKTKMFAMLNKERFVIKLPADRVSSLINSDEGLPFEVGTGKPQKEWVHIPLKTLEQWITLAQEANEYATTLVKR